MVERKLTNPKEEDALNIREYVSIVLDIFEQINIKKKDEAQAKKQFSNASESDN
jgi:hypothetical protein